MKRIVIFSVLLAMVFGFAAFQCSSTELQSAKLYIQQKNLEKAKESLLKEVEKNPKSDEGYYLLGFVYGEEGEFEKMLENFDKSLEISNKFAEQIAQSRKYHWANQFNRGVGYFNKAAKTTDKDTTRMHFDEAIKAFNMAIKCEPDSLDTYSNLVAAYLNIGDYEAAINPLETMNKLNPSPDTYSRLGEIYSSMGAQEMENFKDSGNKEDSVSAMKYYNKAISILVEGKEKFPKNGDILLILSNAYIAADKADVAMEAFKEGVETEPNNKYYRYNYGVMLLNEENFEEAAKQFNKAVEIDPEYTNAIYNLAVTYVKWGAKIREETAEEEEENTEYMKKYELALPYLEKYLEMEPNDPALWELLGKVYANLGMQEKSLEAFDKADQLRQ